MEWDVWVIQAFFCDIRHISNGQYLLVDGAPEVERMQPEMNINVQFYQKLYMDGACSFQSQFIPGTVSLHKFNKGRICIVALALNFIFIAKKD